MWNFHLPLLLCCFTCIFAPITHSLPQGEQNESLEPSITKQSDAQVDDKRTNKLPLLSGRTKNSVQANDSNICFPYFIAQDVDALLVQAARMLSKPINPRQRSWLQLFVHRLDALSRQLRSLPAEHKNMCFQTRKKILSEANVEDSLIDLTPEEMELRFAKEIFNVQDRSHKPRDHTKQYVMGRVANKRMKFGPYWLPIKKNSNFDPRSLASKYMASAAQQKPIIAVQNVKSTTEDTHDGEPMKYEDGSTNTVAENTSFLPRSAKKSIPWLKYQGQINTAKGKTESPVPSVSENTDAVSNDDDKSNVITKARYTTSVGAGVTTKSVQSPTKSSSNKYEEDDVVMQLHAGIASTTKVPQISPTSIPSSPSASAFDVDVEPMGTQDKTEITESATNLQKQQNRYGLSGRHESKPWSPHAVPFERFDESGVYSKQYNNDNRLDFDYEEQGAAIGELYADEDSTPLRQIAIPSSVEQFKGISNDLQDVETAEIDDDDDAVIQLRALKTPDTTDPPGLSTDLQEVQTISQNTAPSNTKPQPMNPTNSEIVPDKVLARLAGPSGRVHRRESESRDITSSLVVDDKK